LLEDLKAFPFGAIWDHFCLSQDVPADVQWPREIEDYEKTVLSRRGRRIDEDGKKDLKSTA
jgi:L-rhamnose isomerase